jgi:hypothetical protein
MAENRIKMALEANSLSENMADAANDIKVGKHKPELQKLDCIYDDEPLGFEKRSNQSESQDASTGSFARN